MGPQQAAIDELVGFFGDTGGMPSDRQWAALLGAADRGPICVLNLVKLRPEADYGVESGEPVRTGLEAFMLYSAGSVPRIIAQMTVLISSRIHS